MPWDLGASAGLLVAAVMRAYLVCTAGAIDAVLVVAASLYAAGVGAAVVSAPAGLLVAAAVGAALVCTTVSSDTMVVGAAL